MRVCEHVVLDIETTGLLKTDEIVQIAAACGDNHFDVYIMPKKPMSERASEMTGIKIRDNKMFVNETAVKAVSPRDGFLSFLNFLKQLKKPCILIAHNGDYFDIPRIFDLARSLNLFKELMSFVKGTCDSLCLFKYVLFERALDGQSFKQVDLANEYLDKNDVMTAHNALNDVLVLQKLLEKICNDKSIIIQNTNSIKFVRYF